MFESLQGVYLISFNFLPAWMAQWEIPVQARVKSN